jgi:hypothetical protein
MRNQLLRVICVLLTLLIAASCEQTENSDQAPAALPLSPKPDTTPTTTTTTPASAAPATPPPPPAVPAPLKAGDKVRAKWTNGDWYPGKITAAHDDGTFDVRYDDGDVSKRLPAAKVRPRSARPPAAASTSTSAGGAPRCSAGRRRCEGRCIDVSDDPRNCGDCGRMCAEACMRGSCVSNTFKYGDGLGN